MKDIVERLRNKAGHTYGDLLWEAADEIERLEFLCQHWEVKYNRIKVDYVDLVEKGKLRPYVKDAEVRQQ